MNNPQIQDIAISCDEDEDGGQVYQAHIFMVDHRVIKLDPYNSLEAAQKSAEDFLKMMIKVKQAIQEESDRV